MFVFFRLSKWYLGVFYVKSKSTYINPHIVCWSKSRLVLTKFGRPSTLDIDKDIAYNYNRRKSTVKETKVFWQTNIQMIVDYAFPLCGLIAISVWIKSVGKFLGMVKGLLHYLPCCGTNIHYETEANFSSLGWEHFWVVWCIPVPTPSKDPEIIKFFFIWIFFDIIAF